MKRFILIATFFFFIPTFAQTVTQKQMALMFKKTATWCNSCGTWGWEFFDEIWDTRKNTAVVFELHNSTTSKLHTAAGVSLISYAPYVSSTPAFYVNMKNETQYVGSSINLTTTKSRVRKAIDSTAAASPLANSDFITSISKDSLHIKTKVKFFENADGEFYLGIYIAEDNVIKYQNGIANDAVHKQPLRAAATTNVMGNLIVNGKVTSGTEFTSSISYKLLTDWIPSNLRVFTVIWKKNGTKYDYVNAFRGYINAAAISPISENLCKPLVYPSVASSHQSVQFDVNCLLNDDVKIDILDQMGRNVTTIFNGKISEGNNSFELNNNLKPGLYYVSLTATNSRKAYKFIIL